MMMFSDSMMQVFEKFNIDIFLMIYWIDVKLNGESRALKKTLVSETIL